MKSGRKHDLRGLRAPLAEERGCLVETDRPGGLLGALRAYLRVLGVVLLAGWVVGTSVVLLAGSVMPG